MKIAPVVLAVVLLTGCASQQTAETPVVAEVEPAPSLDSSPSPEALTRPPLSSLVLTNSGLDYLVIDEPIPTVTDDSAIVTLVPDACGDLNGGNAWLATYDGLPFNVMAGGVDDEGPLLAINVYSNEISSSEGIHVGSTEADLTAAYPSATRDEGDGSFTTFEVHDSGTRLLFFVVRDLDSVPFGYDENAGVTADSVGLIRVISDEATGGGGAYQGPCSD